MYLLLMFLMPLKMSQLTGKAEVGLFHHVHNWMFADFYLGLNSGSNDVK